MRWAIGNLSDDFLKTRSTPHIETNLLPILNPLSSPVTRQSLLVTRYSSPIPVPRCQWHHRRVNFVLKSRVAVWPNCRMAVKIVPIP
jgi:hypothetical protein